VLIVALRMQGYVGERSGEGALKWNANSLKRAVTWWQLVKIELSAPPFIHFYLKELQETPRRGQMIGLVTREASRVSAKDLLF
jgi:hypothetical protein